ncbi:unnamed protein product [Lepidochelys kempii]
MDPAGVVSGPSAKTADPPTHALERMALRFPALHPRCTARPGTHLPDRCPPPSQLGPDSAAPIAAPGAQAGEIIGGQETRPHTRPYMAIVSIEVRRNWVPDPGGRVGDGSSL